MDEELFKNLVNTIGWPAAAVFGMLTILWKLGNRAVNNQWKFLRFLSRQIKAMVKTQKEIPAKIEGACRYPRLHEPEDNNKPA